jgi:uncharacterized protein with PIN domain
VTIPFPSSGWPNIGWSCPKCGRVYAPSVSLCFLCNASVPSPAVEYVDPRTCAHEYDFGQTMIRCLKCGTIPKLPG